MTKRTKEQTEVECWRETVADLKAQKAGFVQTAADLQGQMDAIRTEAETNPRAVIRISEQRELAGRHRETREAIELADLQIDSAGRMLAEAEQQENAEALTVLQREYAAVFDAALAALGHWVDNELAELENKAGEIVQHRGTPRVFFGAVMVAQIRRTIEYHRAYDYRAAWLDW
jgi:hypothetical protein